MRGIHPEEMEQLKTQEGNLKPKATPNDCGVGDVQNSHE
jgi:hypothetical protein